MDYIDWLIGKAIALTVLAFVWGLYCGLTGRSLGSGRQEDHSEPTRR